MAINRTSPKKGKVVDIPTAPTIGTATASGESATVAFTAATKGGPATTYTALSNPGSVTGTGSSSPITVTGLTAGTSYTFTVRGNNATGSSEYSVASNSIVPTANTSYESIATVTVGASPQSSITFSSIPQTYKHLQIRYFARDNAATAGTDDMYFVFNGGASASYAWHRLIGDGASASAGNGTAQSTGRLSASAISRNGNTGGIFSTGIIDILDYQNTNKYKTVRSLYGCETNASNGSIAFGSSLWDGTTNAITSITFTIENSNSFVQNTQFALYGIKG